LVSYIEEGREQGAGEDTSTQKGRDN